MKQSLSAVSGVFVLCAVTGGASAQTVGGNAAARTDLYHVQFVKAAPGQAAALGDALLAQDPESAHAGPSGRAAPPVWG